jgi:proteasome lid subunit RPN8/RPN11
MECNLESVTGNYSAVPMLSGARDRMMAYAHLSGGHEVYGFLVAPKSSTDGIVRHVVLAQNQHVSAAHAGISEAAAGESKAEMENLGYKPIGFWHSHGNGSVWHSGTDDANMEALLRSFAGNNEHRKATRNPNAQYIDYDHNAIVCRVNGSEVRLSLDRAGLGYENRFVGTDYMVVGGAPVLAVITTDLRVLVRNGPCALEAKDVRELRVSPAREEQVHITGLAYSVVVNSKGDAYAEMAVNNWCSVCEREETRINKNVKVNVIEGSSAPFSQEELLSELETRVAGFRRGKKWSILSAITDNS